MSYLVHPVSTGWKPELCLAAVWGAAATPRAF